MKINSAQNRYWSIKASIEIFDKEKNEGFRLIPSIENILFIETIDKDGNVQTRTSVDFDDLRKLANKDAESL